MDSLLAKLNISEVKFRLSIPSQTEVTKSRQHLVSHETTCCGVCFKQSDDRTEENVDWVQCCWVHVTGAIYIPAYNAGL